MSDTTGKLSEAGIEAIMAECQEHNENIGAGERDPGRLRRDAEFIYMHRHGGISVETLCMMMTDVEFAARLAHIDAERAEKAKLAVEPRPGFAPDVRAAYAQIQRLFYACGDGTGKLDAGWGIVVVTKALEALSEGIKVEKTLPTPQQVEDATIVRDAVARLKKLGEDYHADAVGHVAARLGGTVPERGEAKQ